MTRTTYVELVSDDRALVGYWRFGETSGLVAKDVTGRHDGIYQDVRLGAPGALRGDDDTAANFDRLTSVVLVGDSEDFAFPGVSEFSIEAWIKLGREPSANQRIVSRRLDDGESADGYELVVTPARAITFNRHAGEGVDHLVTRRAIEVGEWAQVVATYDGETMRVFVDGELADEIAAVEALAQTRAQLDLGRRANSSGTSTFFGTIDEVSITGRAMAAEEVKSRFSAACNGTRVDLPAPAEAVPELWPDTVSKLLGADVWNDRDGSDACRFLMLPLHAAFAFGRSDWIAEFADHSNRFARASAASGVALEDPVARLDYLFLWTRFTALAVAADRSEVVDEDLVAICAEEFGSRWPEERAFLLASLARNESDGGRSSVLDDVHLLLFAIAADLLASGVVEDDSILEALTEARDLAVRAFASEVRWTENGGCLLEAIAEAYRVPELLESLRGAFDDSEPGRRFFDNLRVGFEPQVLSSVENGARPSTLPTTFLFGWWARLPSQRIADAYSSLAESFPLPDDVVAGHVEKSGNQAHHPLCTGAAPYENGFYELLVRLAAVIEPLPGPPPVVPQ